MRRSLIGLVILAAGWFTLYQPTAAYAQATRTWVSGVGDDANPCSRTAPCKTWPGAISKTAAGGEIDALDPGGFGGLTVTKSITLDGGGGQVASTLVAGTPGITVNAGATDVVVIRNLRLMGVLGNGSSPGTAGTIGIRILGGATVVIDHCVIEGFAQQGIVDTRSAGQLVVSDTIVQDNGGAGVAVAPSSSGAVRAQLSGVVSVGNAFGIATGSGAKVVAEKSTFAANTTGVETDGGGTLVVNDSGINNNTTGISVQGTVVLANDDVTFNTTGIGGSGAAQSYSNNRFFGNGAGNGINPIGNTSNPTGQQ